MIGKVSNPVLGRALKDTSESTSERTRLHSSLKSLEKEKLDAMQEKQARLEKENEKLQQKLKIHELETRNKTLEEERTSRSTNTATVSEAQQSLLKDAILIALQQLPLD